MPQVVGALDPQTLQLGAAIRAARLAKAFTLVELARLSNLSHPFLSQLERGHARPSMASLERIARALETSQLDLLAGAADFDATDAWGEVTVSAHGRSAPRVETRAHVVRASEGTRGPYAEGQGRLLVDARARFQPMDFTASNAGFGDFYHHAEDEFVTVIAGGVVVDLSGDGEFVLAAGDSVYYQGGTAHRWRSLDSGAYRLLIVKQRL
ncbi:helix-turn-helix domain-containing protein [Subtercola boreus]|uniref:HTH cro/C1-type domain-containing protein n=1 Tax=Subtercola boreus TaxID=120213 RepID=A0A3E0WBS3_9MICO|nr:XRE family transcriptional regulator [Subtercola boreus]RFA21997.1 hypothetical protein B7R24_04735 [Subtercola boreus]RFA22177.1 hypothetical protein B7R23_04680 [Subtercola boreus]RFA28039.1 hypothetical protein B7R25_04805 [Subtercola boreus]